MERLTYRDDKGWYVNGENGERLRGPYIDRLAAYEDTGLEPEDLKKPFNEDAILKLAAQCFGTTPDHLKELVQAEKNGLLVVLPAQTVFEITWDAGESCDLSCPVSINGHGCCELCDNGVQFIDERPCCQEHISQIGKTVFLTREEAEAALKKMEESK